MGKVDVNMFDKVFPRFVSCRECDRKFDLCDGQQADEWTFGHDCEAAA